MAITAEELNIILQVRDDAFRKALAADQRRVNNFSNRVRKDTRAVTQAYNSMGRSAGANRAALQNASFQIQDIVTQITMGTAPTKALAVQLPQLLGGFGALGAVAGVAVGVLGYFVDEASEGASASKDLGDELNAAYNSASSALDKAKEAQERYAAAIALTGAAQSQVTPEILGNLKLEAQAREALAQLEMVKLEQSKKALSESLSGHKAQYDELIRYATAGIQAGIDAAREIGNETLIAQGMEALKAATAAVNDENEDLILKIREQQAELDLVNSLLAQNNSEASEFIDNLIDANTAAEGVSSAVAAINFSQAIEGAIALSEQLGVSLHMAMQIMGIVGAAAQAAADKANVVFDPRDPRYNAEVAGVASRLSAFKQLQDSGALYRSTPVAKAKGGKKGGGGSSKAQRDPLADLIKEIELNQKLLGVSEAREQVMRRLGDDAERYNETEIASVVARIQAYEDEKAALEGIRNQQQDIANTLEGALTDAWMSAINGTESFGDAIKGMARTVISELTRILVVQRMVGSFDSATGKGSGIVGLLMGAFTGRASGGSVMAGQPYRVGEHGPEPFVPAQNGRILSVAQAKGAVAGGGGATTVYQNNTFTTDVRQTVRAELKSFAPQLIDASVAAMEAKQGRSVR